MRLAYLECPGGLKVVGELKGTEENAFSRNERSDLRETSRSRLKPKG